MWSPLPPNGLVRELILAQVFALRQRDRQQFEQAVTASVVSAQSEESACGNGEGNMEQTSYLNGVH
jgi:hypothetical protein